MKQQEAQRSRPRRRKPTQAEDQPQFLRKTYHMVDSSPEDIVVWSSAGDSFVIKDIARFSQEVIPTAFKHNKFRSFVRQLNIYGFRKVRSVDSNPNISEFKHPFFRRGEPHLLSQIKRETHFVDHDQQNSFGSPDELTATAPTLQEQYIQLVDRIDGISSILARLVIGNPGLHITEDDSTSLQALMAPNPPYARSSSSSSEISIDDNGTKKRRVDASVFLDVGEDDMDDDIDEADDGARFTEEDLASFLDVLLEDDGGQSHFTEVDGVTDAEPRVIEASNGSGTAFFADLRPSLYSLNRLDGKDLQHFQYSSDLDASVPVVVAGSVDVDSSQKNFVDLEKKEQKIVELAQQLSELIPAEAAGAESLQPLAAMVKDLPPELQGRFVDQMAAAMGARLAELANRSEGPAPVVAQLDFSKGFFSKCQAEKLDDDPGSETSTGAPLGEGTIGENSPGAGVSSRTYVRVRFCPFEGVPVDASFSQQYCVVTGLPVDLFNGPSSEDPADGDVRVPVRVRFCPIFGKDVANYHRKQRFCPVTGKPFLPEGENAPSPPLSASSTASSSPSQTISVTSKLGVEIGSGHVSKSLESDCDHSRSRSNISDSGGDGDTEDSAGKPVSSPSDSSSGITRVLECRCM